MRGEPLRPQLKPVRVEREPKRMRQISAKRAAKIAAGEARPGMKRSFMRPKPPRRLLTEDAGRMQFAHPKPTLPDGTSHSRRPREWGRMSWLHSWRTCFVRAFFQEAWSPFDSEGPMAIAIQVKLVGLFPPCDGEFQCAHLFGRYGVDSDGKTILACRDHHMDIDQTRRWFLVLTKPERLWLKTFLAARATLAWAGLPIEERARWNEIGEARFGRHRGAA